MEEENKPELDMLEFEEDGDSELWLVSYADMMTLLACFFILMMAFANFDPVGFQEKTKEISKHFNKDKYKSSETKLTRLQEEVARHPELKKMSKVSIKNGQLVISFSGSALFDSGTFQIKQKVVPVIDSMIDIVKTQNPNYRIVVEGHTDNTPTQGKGVFSSNWTLSGARASSVIERFEYFGFPPKDLKVLGLGSSKPLVPNEDANGVAIPENQNMNRRVIIKVLEPIDGIKKVKLGLGVYFDDTSAGK